MSLINRQILVRNFIRSTRPYRACLNVYTVRFNSNGSNQQLQPQPQPQQPHSHQPTKYSLPDFTQISTINHSDFMENIAKRCYGCGSPFHEDEPNTAGYNPFEAEKRKAAKKKNILSIKIEKDKQIDELYNSLDQSKQDILLNEGIIQADPTNIDTSLPSTAQSIAEAKEQKRSKLSKIFCKWCRESLNSKYLRLSPPIANKKQILDSIPNDATIIHLFDAMDFPTTVDFDLIELSKKRKGKILWVMNRCDLIMPDNVRTQGRTLNYLLSELNRMATVKIPKENVFTISSNFNWNIEELFPHLTEDNYLVGHANTGKSTLALYLAHRFRQAGNGRKFWGLGSWGNPFITQQPTTYLLKGDKYLTDLPSYPENATNTELPSSRISRFKAIYPDRTYIPQLPKEPINSSPTPVTTTKGIYDLLKPNYVIKLTNGHRVFRTPGVYNSPNVVVSTLPSQFISIGGLVAIKRNYPIHIISWSIFPDSNYKSRVVSSLEKVTAINKSTNKNHERWTLVRPEKASEPLKKKMTMIFGGEGVSLAIRGLGLVHLHAYGKIPEEGIELEVYAMDDVKIMRRTDILPFIRNPRNALKELKAKARREKEQAEAFALKMKKQQKRNQIQQDAAIVDSYSDS